MTAVMAEQQILSVKFIMFILTYLKGQKSQTNSSNNDVIVLQPITEGINAALLRGKNKIEW